MNASELADRLAALPILSRVPLDELEWLVRHGAYDVLAAGDVIVVKGDRVEHLWIIFSGRIAVHRDTAAGRRQVMSWGPGDVTGRLPYSRMSVAEVDVRLEEEAETLALHERHFPEMVGRCPVFTEHTVHLMVDRARHFKASELQVEKLVSLGRLSAGLAHELNNPASATVRGAALLREGLADTEAAARALFSSGLSEEGLATVDRVRSGCLAASTAGVRSALELADRESELEEWLDDHDCDPDHAATLADTSVTVEALDELARSLTGKGLDAAVRWVAASCGTHSIAADVEGAAKRIHDLVAAVKRFSYMDNLTAAHAVDVAEGLRDTIAVLSSKARGKGAAVRLALDPDLPPVVASGSELNQVWMNLIDNALDAIAEEGTVEVEAGLEREHVVVRVIDDGPGIPADVADHIFDPFFTTKGPGHGTGLGLDIARRIVTQNQGQIDVESKPGRTAFRVRLSAGAAG